MCANFSKNNINMNLKTRLSIISKKQVTFEDNVQDSDKKRIQKNSFKMDVNQNLRDSTNNQSETNLK